MKFIRHTRSGPKEIRILKGQQWRDADPRSRFPKTIQITSVTSEEMQAKLVANGEIDRSSKRIYRFVTEKFASRVDTQSGYTLVRDVGPVR